MSEINNEQIEIPVPQEKITIPVGFDFQVYTVENVDVPIVMLSLNSFLEMTNALLMSNMVAKDPNIMDLNAVIQVKLANLNGIQVMYEDKVLADEIDKVFANIHAKSSLIEDAEVEEITEIGEVELNTEQ